METQARQFEGTGPERALSLDRVLVPLDLTDHAERAIGTASAIAQRIGCPLTLFSWHWDAGEVSVRHDYIEGLLDQRGLVGDVEVEHTEDRSPAGPIVAAARKQDGTLICMATRAHDGLGEIAFGSVAADVLRRSTTPVLFVGPNASSAPQDLMGPVTVCLDGSDFAESAVPVAEAWATALGVRTELISVLEPPPRHGSSAWDDVDVIEGGYLVRLAHQSNGGSSWEILHGTEPAEAIAEYTKDRASLIVVSTHGRGGLARVIGSVALRIAHKAHCPVLLVRPPSENR
ncbi:MAG: universal stress protein [Microthrixaceae bacterium]